MKTWLLSGLMVLMSTVAFAATEVVDGIEWTYQVSNGEAQIYKGSQSSAIPKSTSGTITIPSILGGCPVTSIGMYAFFNCSSLTSVTIPEGVTSIGEDAFYGCSSLTSVTIPEGVTTIGEWAFYGCSSLTSVTIPEGVTSIGSYAFDGCTNLPKDANGVQYESNTKVLLIKAPTLLTGEFVIPSSVRIVGSSAFCGCSSLTSVTIPSSVTSIGSNAFEGCSSLTSVMIPEGVTTIGSGAFSGCSSLTSVTIPSSVTSIGSNAFDSNTSVEVGGQRTLICSTWPQGLNRSIKASVIIPEGVTTIGSDAFKGCSGLTSVTIPSSVTTIGSSAFSGCSGLTSIMIPSSVTTIGGWAFYECSKLTTVTIPSSVTSIGESAFYNCSSLPSVTIPSSVTFIGPSAFWNCSSLTSVHISDVSAWCSINFGNSSSNPLCYAKNGLYLNGEKITTAIISSSVTKISLNAFYGCSSLKSVTIPEGVTSIGGSAFSGCSGLKSVTIPEGVTSIGDSAFYGCSALTSVMIPEGVTSIGAGAFSGCSSLTSVTIPEGVISIGSYTFYGCSSLTSVTILEGVTTIGDYAFYGCSRLTSVTIPEGVTTIGDHVFYNCSGLTSVMIPEGVTSIGDYAFNGCSSLTSVTIPSSVTSIERSAFGYPGNFGDYHEMHLKNLTHLAFNGPVCSNLLDVIDFFQAQYGWQVTYSEAYGADWKRAWQKYEKSKNPPQAGYLHVGPSARPNAPSVTILSSQIRETDPTILDVVYKVTSTKPTVKVRALAFQDGERSFAKVVRPETFVEGTAANIGDGIVPNQVYTLSWKVASDWQTTLAKLKFEVLAVEDELLPLELVTLPATATQPKLQFSWNVVEKQAIFDALLWLYADQDLGLTLSGGTLRHGSQTLASGKNLYQTGYDALVYLYQKMGYELLQGERLEYVKRRTRLDLPGISQRQYAVKVLSETDSSDEE